MFIRLGWLAAVRNIHRTGLAVASIALSTVVIVSGLILAQGQPGAAHGGFREAIGGDIVIAPETLAIPGTTPRGGAQLELVRRSPDAPGLMSYFFPQLMSRGIAGRPNPSDLTADELRAVDGVKDVTSYRTLPVRMHVEDGSHLMMIRPRTPEVDDWYGLDERVVEGRYLQPEDAGEMVGVLETHRIWRDDPEAGTYARDRWNDTRAVLIGGVPSIRRYTPPSPGQDIQLILNAHGGVNDDQSDEVSVSLQVAGHTEFRVGTVHWGSQALGAAGLREVHRFDEEDPLRYIQEPLYWMLPEIWVTEETFARLEEAAGVTAAATEYIVVAEDYSAVNVLADDLRARYDGATVLTVDQLVSLSDMTPEVSVSVPLEDIARGYSDLDARGRTIMSAPDWFELTLVALALAVAAILYLGNLYVVTINRTRELAALKALGSFNEQLLVAALTEVLVISAAGTLIGYLVTAPMLIHLWVSNDIGLWPITVRLAGGLVLAGGLTMMISLVMAMFPFLRTARVSPREAMRNA